MAVSAANYISITLLTALHSIYESIEFLTHYFGKVLPIINI